ncbi:MAG: tetratricopeptide repeat protein [Synechococcaceae cyanobacterium RM1_1_27]|nr:tetratricopeptide repeat protein [Synechococcaceae cyanobacterium RM1_1_27]
MVSSTDYRKDFNQALKAYADEDYERAVKLFGQITATRPDDPELKLWLASAQQQAGNYGERAAFMRSCSAVALIPIMCKPPKMVSISCSKPLRGLGLTPGIMVGRVNISPGLMMAGIPAMDSQVSLKMGDLARMI